jgi:hypothetical protein
MSSARLETDKLAAQTTEEARSRVQEALDRLPQDIASHGLSADLQEPFSKPLKDFMAGIGGVSEFYQIFALSDRVGSLIQGLEKRSGRSKRSGRVLHQLRPRGR